jgi:sugar phosphate isomerase/epimerase
MNNKTRRDFLKASTGLLGMAIAGPSSFFSLPTQLLSFSTLGCPGWTFPTILNCAVQNDYNGIEIRGILGQLDLTKCPEFSSAERIASTRKMVEEQGLRIVDLGTSAEMHHSDPAKRLSNLNEAKRFIDLAEQLNCPYIRVFPNNLPKDEKREATIDLIIKGLMELGEYAKGTKVSVLMESHGDAVDTLELKKIMDSANHQNVGMVWDVFNMWSVTKEPPTKVYQQLKKYILHTHIKDAKIINGKEHYTLLGKGESPIFEAIDVLYNDGYKGYYSFEWEKLWHPEIEEPEIALPDYPKVMRKHFKY